MKRLLGLLLVMGMVGCGKQNGPPPGITNTRPGIAKPLPAKPNKPQAKIDEPPVQAVDTPPAGEAALPATPNKPQAKVDEPTVQTVDASKLVRRDGLMYEGDSETPFTGGVVSKHANGQKELEATYKDGKKVSETKWDKEGNEIK